VPVTDLPPPAVFEDKMSDVTTGAGALGQPDAIDSPVALHRLDVHRVRLGIDLRVGGVRVHDVAPGGQDRRDHPISVRPAVLLDRGGPAARVQVGHPQFQAAAVEGVVDQRCADVASLNPVRDVSGAVKSK
jgi:hypothetical protein